MNITCLPGHTDVEGNKNMDESARKKVCPALIALYYLCNLFLILKNVGKSFLRFHQMSVCSTFMDDLD